MARYGAIPLKSALWDAADFAIDTHVETYSLSRPHKIEEVKVTGLLPLDTDGDTVAVDVSYSTDGFVASDVEVAALAAVEYNDTTVVVGAIETMISNDIPLTDASKDKDGTVRVPANAVVRITITATGSSADGGVQVDVLGHIL